MKLIMTKGLPGSGKSTWAKTQKGFKRVNKDDLRHMLDDGVWSKTNEQFVLTARNRLIESALGRGLSIICDDTNLHPKHEAELRAIADQFKAEFEIKDFTYVPIEVCIAQDLQRTNSVGEQVIRKHYNQFLRPKIVPAVVDPNKSSAIICDIDGTLALFGDANPYDRDFINDSVNKVVADIITEFSDIYTIILVSGRNGKYKEITESWLDKHEIYYDLLYMRKPDDTRKDVIVKEELYREFIEPKFNIAFVLDDRNQVVEFWRSIGLTCLQVADGNF